MKLRNCFPSRCCGPCSVYSFAQYGVQANPPSGSDLPMITLFQEGELITLNTNTEIILSAGYLYLVDYIFSATTEISGYMQITPKIDGSLKLLYSFFAPANAKERNTSASGSFTTNAAFEKDAVLSFALAYPETVRNIDISGSISVTSLYKVR